MLRKTSKVCCCSCFHADGSRVNQAKTIRNSRALHARAYGFGFGQGIDQPSSFQTKPVWINAFGTSTVATSLFSFASIIDVRNTDAIDTVGLDFSSLSDHCLCGFPFAHVLAFTDWSTFFSVRKINESKTLFASVAARVFSTTGSSKLDKDS